jgi:protein-S-isoprenylcysteine O-methyltransferase Ste14
MSATAMPPSPAWYRFRGWLFFAVVWLAFFVGYFVQGTAAGMGAGQPLPLYELARRSGGDGAMHATFWVAAVLFFAGFLMRLWGAAYLSRPVVWSGNVRTDALVVAGPFRLTRNPLYLGNLLMFTALGVFGPPAALPFLVIGSWLALRACILHEEAALRARFGPAFERYCAQVPRLFPRLTPVPGDAIRPSWRSGFLSEIGSAIWSLGMLALAIAGPRAIPLYWAFLILGVLVIPSSGALASRFAERRIPR